MIVINEILNIEGGDNKTHCLEIGISVLFYENCELLTVGYHLFEMHLTNDLTDITFENFSCNSCDILGLFVQEVLGSLLDELRAVTDLNVNGSINHDVDVVSGRNC